MHYYLFLIQQIFFSVEYLYRLIILIGFEKKSILSKLCFINALDILGIEKRERYLFTDKKSICSTRICNEIIFVSSYIFNFLINIKPLRWRLHFSSCLYLSIKPKPWPKCWRTRMFRLALHDSFICPCMMFWHYVDMFIYLYLICNYFFPFCLCMFWHNIDMFIYLYLKCYNFFHFVSMYDVLT